MTNMLLMMQRDECGTKASSILLTYKLFLIYENKKKEQEKLVCLSLPSPYLGKCQDQNSPKESMLCHQKTVLKTYSQFC